MGKTLIIKGADFSSVKVGNVEIPRELQERTLRWINASDNNIMTDDQKLALDDLVIALYNQENGFASKIDRLWIPMIAVDKSHSLYEYINEINSYNNMSQEVKDLFDDDTKVLFGNYGLYTLDQFGPLTIDPSVEINMKNFSLLYINSMPIESIALGTKSRGGIGITSARSTSLTGHTCFVYTKQTYNANNLKFPLDDTDATTVDGTSEYLGCKLRGGVSDNGVVKHFLNGTLITKSYASFNEGNETGINIIGCVPTRTESDNTPYGAYILAKALTESELNILKTKIEGLLSAMKES